MEKISNILKPNARTRVTDTSNSQPIRPGAPSFGRPMGRVTTAAKDFDVEERVSFSPEGRNKAESDKLDAVREMADKFSIKKTKEEFVGEGALSQRVSEDSMAKALLRDEGPSQELPQE